MIRHQIGVFEMANLYETDSTPSVRSGWNETYDVFLASDGEIYAEDVEDYIAENYSTFPITGCTYEISPDGMSATLHVCEDCCD